MSYADIISYVYEKLKQTRFKRTYTAVGEPSDFFKPTQKDKPSPTSDYTSHQVRRYLRSGFDTSFLIRPVTDTNSMEIAVDDNHLVVCDPNYDPDNLRVGDMITYDYPRENPRMLILHRIIEFKPGGWIKTKGDNNLRADPLVHPDQVRERVVGLSWFRQTESAD